MQYGPYNAVVLDWHDGDTCHMSLDLGFGISMLRACRIFGINAPELGTQPGTDALVYARQLCPNNTKVTVISHGWDKYGNRFDGAITLPDGTDFGTLMINSGHAVPYAG